MRSRLRDSENFKQGMTASAIMGAVATVASFAMTVSSLFTPNTMPQNLHAQNPTNFNNTHTRIVEVQPEHYLGSDAHMEDLVSQFSTAGSALASSAPILKENPRFQSATPTVTSDIDVSSAVAPINSIQLESSTLENIPAPESIYSSTSEWISETNDSTPNIDIESTEILTTASAVTSFDNSVAEVTDLNEASTLISVSPDTIEEPSIHADTITYQPTNEELLAMEERLNAIVHG